MSTDAVAVLDAHRPDDAVIGEEGSDHRGAGARRWYVDGIDGTVAFAANIATWCSAVVLEDEHGPKAAAVYHRGWTNLLCWFGREFAMNWAGATNTLTGCGSTSHILRRSRTGRLHAASAEQVACGKVRIETGALLHGRCL